MAKYQVITVKKMWMNDYYEVEAKNKEKAGQKVLKGEAAPYDSDYLGGDPYAKPQIEAIFKL